MAADLERLRALRDAAALSRNSSDGVLCASTNEMLALQGYIEHYADDIIAELTDLREARPVYDAAMKWFTALSDRGVEWNDLLKALDRAATTAPARSKALTARPVSCEACNEMAKRVAVLEEECRAGRACDARRASWEPVPDLEGYKEWDAMLAARFATDENGGLGA